MPLRLPALTLNADAESVRRARAWVRAIFEDLARRDLLDAAEVGVSELVTNALLHGAPPISVQVRGTQQHPRVEVHDGSPTPPVMTFNPADEDQLLATYGRGLGLVATLSTAWGADLTQDGKIVWFAPAAERRRGGDLSGDVFDLAQVLRGGEADTVHRSSLTRIRILGLPVVPYARFQQRYFDLARELRLLSLNPSDDYPAAQRFSAVFLEAERLSQQVQGYRLSPALAQHRDVVDLDLLVPPRLPGTMQRLLDTLDLVDEHCRQEHMLTLAASSDEQRLIRWWLTEFVRQGSGHEPTSWPDHMRTRGHPLQGAHLRNE